MAKCSKAVEILPTLPIDIMTGSTKHNTFRVDKQGRNMVMPKVEQTNKTGRDSAIVKGAPAKWKTLNAEQKQYWQEIANQYDFYTRWTAFVSSFFLSVDLYGLEYTMNHELNYIHSKNRGKKEEHWENSLQRRVKYKPDPAHYQITEMNLQLYPVRFSNPFMFIKLLDLTDINNALACKMIYRTDAIVEYEFFPSEEGEVEVEKGSYIKHSRARTGTQKYELFQS